MWFSLNECLQIFMPERNEIILWVFLHSWHAECHTHNDREAVWGDVCEVLLSFQANWLNLENIPSWWWARVITIFYCAAHKRDQPIHKVSQWDASPSWLPPAGYWQLWKRWGHPRWGCWWSCVGRELLESFCWHLLNSACQDRDRFSLLEKAN